MDTIFDRYIRVRIPAEHDFARDLAPLKTVCRWTTGLWDFGPHSQCKWNELQNTTRDIQSTERIPHQRIQDPGLEHSP